jgi:hypothetical protein
MNTDTLERMTPQQFKEKWNCRHPFAGDTKGASFPMTREEALTKRFIQSQGQKNMVSIDLDLEQADWYLKELIFDKEVLPEPNFITTNPETSHCQAVWFITEGVSTPKGIAYLNFIQKEFTEIIGSDEGFNHSKIRNPTHPAQVTEWGTSKIYTLKELQGFLDPKPAHWYKKKPGKETAHLGRHCQLFDELSSWSYIEWRKPNFETRILMEAQRINSEFSSPLPPSHLHATIKSIVKFIRLHFTEEKFSAIQRIRANKRWKGQGARTNEKLLAYVEAGFTVKEISEAEGKSYEAMKKAVQRAKKSISS